MRRAAFGGKAEKNPASLLVALQKPRLAHDFEMPADARLALTQNERELTDIQLALR